MEECVTATFHETRNSPNQYYLHSSTRTGPCLWKYTHHCVIYGSIHLECMPTWTEACGCLHLRESSQPPSEYHVEDNSGFKYIRTLLVIACNLDKNGTVASHPKKSFLELSIALGPCPENPSSHGGTLKNPRHHNAQPSHFLTPEFCQPELPLHHPNSSRSLDLSPLRLHGVCRYSVVLEMEGCQSGIPLEGDGKRLINIASARTSFCALHLKKS